MNEVSRTHGPTIASSRECAYTQQLNAGFPLLQFGPQLEAEFKRTFLTALRKPLIARMIAGLLFVEWAAWAYTQVGAAGDLSANAIALRQWVLLALSPVLVLLPFIPRLYERVWLIVAPTLLAIIGLVGGYSAAAAVAAGNPHAFIALIAMLFACMLLAGLLFWQLLAAGSIIAVSYLVSLQMHTADPAVMQFQATVTLFITTAAAVLHYGIERGFRTGYLARRILQDIGRHDALTGLKNRRAFDDALQGLWKQGLRDKQALGLLLFDVDHFKAYNDHYGHQAGDRCLTAIGQVLANAERRPFDIAARIGGEEFALLLYGASSEYINAVAEKLLVEIRELGIPHAQSDTESVVTVSIGAAKAIPVLGRSPASLQQFVDEALYQAKYSGRNRIVWQEGGYEDVVTGAFQVPRSAAR